MAFHEALAFGRGLACWCKKYDEADSQSHLRTDKLDAWTFERGGKTVAEDSTLMYFMKIFSVSQVIHGLPAGEYELRVRAWQSPTGREAALYDYEHAEDKEDGCAGTSAEIYAGPFVKRITTFRRPIRNRASGTMPCASSAWTIRYASGSVRQTFPNDSALQSLMTSASS